jgi:hypothetical protein
VSEFIYEFNKAPFKSSLPSAGEMTKFNSGVYWESERLSVMEPMKKEQKGADRSVCRIVNGIVTIKFLDKQFLQATEGKGDVELAAGLYGEYGNYSAPLEYLVMTRKSNPITSQMYLSNGEVAFPQFSAYGNLAQNIFIRVMFCLPGGAARSEPLPIDTLITGTLIGMNPK